MAAHVRFINTNEKNRGKKAIWEAGGSLLGTLLIYNTQLELLQEVTGNIQSLQANKKHPTDVIWQ